MRLHSILVLLGLLVGFLGGLFVAFSQHDVSAAIPAPAPYTVVTSDGYYNSHGDIAALANRNLLVVYRKGRTHASDQAKIVGKISSDRGQTWSDEFLVFDPRSHPKPGYDAQMPNITVLSTGRVIVTFQLNGEGDSLVIDGIGYIISDDNGQSWRGWGYLDSKFTSFAGGPGRVIELPSGALLLPLNGKNIGEEYTSVSYFKSEDFGDSWYGNSWLNAETVIANGVADKVHYDEPYLVSLGGSQVLLLMRTYLPDQYIYGAASTDGGITWSKPALQFEGSGRPSVTKLSNGNLLFVSRRYAIPQKTVYRISKDNGISWSEEVSTDADNYANEYGGSTEIGGKAYIVYFAETAPIPSCR